MSIATELSRLQTDRNTIRNKLVELGLAPTTANLDVLAAAIDDIINCGAVSITVMEGDTVTIPKGYHNGSGTVSGVAGGGNYSLQSKTATPTKKQQNVTPDSGYYGLSDVTVAAIPEAFQDVTSVDALAEDVLSGKVYVLADGTVTTGTMTNNGAVSKTLSVTSLTYTIAKGYHNGSGKVTIVLDTKTVTPTKESQEITPAAGKVLSKVTVDPIPDNFIDTTDADAAAMNILDGKTAYVNSEKITGTMPNHGSFDRTLDVTNYVETIAPGFYAGGSVKIVPETKTATPTKAAQDITPTSGSVLSKVTVDPIPDAYQDVTEVTAVAADVLSGKKFVRADGAVITGTMPSNAADKTTTLDVNTPSYTIPKGYHNGKTTLVNIVLESKTATPTKATQNITPTSGKVLGRVTVDPIPDNFIDTTDADAEAGHILDGFTAYVNTAKVEGAMPNNGDTSTTMDGLTTTSVSIPAGYTSGGTVSLTNDIETALAAI